MPSATQPLNILISGSGIAGPVTAYWLHRFMPTCQITILERSPQPRLGGQAVDLRSSALPIVKKMGILDKVKEKTTTEVGMQFVYRDGERRATFEATGEEERQSGMQLHIDLTKKIFEEINVKSD
jgi:2-polyprenyl-6-methoxyphenol hydroxylase-like FAD-dependent oxidoreductase